MSPSIAFLVNAANGGNPEALAELMAMAVGTNTFLARRASRELWEHFKIKIRTDPHDPPTEASGVP